MAISLEKIRKRLIEKPKHQTINRAILHQNRIRFHCQTALTAEYREPLDDFLAFVQNLLPHDKFKIFKTLFRYPVHTNEVTAVCFDKLSRIFDGRNPVYNYQFLKTEQRDDWERYRQERLEEPKVWSTRGWEYFQTEINSVLIVDLPAEQKGELPEPYFYWLPIADVLDFKVRHDKMEYIIFKQKDDRIAVIDDESYRVFRKDKSENIGELLVENPHDLGYCPARFFWNDSLSLHDPDVKKSPVTKELEALDWYLFYHISKEHLDLFGAYPIYSGYEQACDFSNAENGDYCDGGFLRDRQGVYRLDKAGLLLPCPKCGNKRIVGAGSFVEVPIPTCDQPDLRNPVQMLSVDRSSLDYNVTEEERLRTNIITAIVGTNEEITTRDALNEQQIKANFESQSTVLNRVKKGFEEAQEFVDATCCRLRYGKSFVSCKINYGTDFYIFSVNELREAYKIAKESGASEAELSALQEQIIATEFRNNDTAKQRLLILSELEPYSQLSIADVVNLRNQGVVSDRDMRIKLNFANYVKRFERENANILDFGAGIKFDKKIQTIYNEFAKYADESINQ